MRTGTQDVVYTNTDHQSFPARITVKSLVRGSEKDMRGDVDEGLDGMVPHYVTLKITNTGRKEIPKAYMVGSDVALNATDFTQAEKVSVSGGRPGGGDLPCADTAPETLEPGKSYDTCLTYALPESAGVLSLTHSADGFLDAGGAVAIWPVRGGLDAASAGLADPGQKVSLRWDAREDGILELPATLVSVTRGSTADLARLDLVDLNKNEQRGVPYYVAVTYTNPGPSNLYLDQAHHVYLLSEGGRQIQGKIPFGVKTEIPGCPADWVATMVSPGDSVTECSVHMVTDESDKPFAVGFMETDRPRLVTWRAPLS
ncbi:hypothetical protein OG599_27740 [Streptomyces sp. NBC_01335]|uniref:hypothetical protein n=1 Tax=Streptomyces sp. NBC_01335 TaxID=2903828 RepID=UPI002E11E5FF|nr:hypothetical protein OG599_27740 [Streptomyces sp. NBC_01335]